MNKIFEMLYEYTKNGKYIDKHFVEQTINILSSSLELSDYIRGVCYNPITLNFGDRYSIASYNFNNGKMKIDMNVIENIINGKIDLNWLLYYKCESEDFFKGYERILYINLLILNVLFHEFEHVKQKKNIFLRKNDISTQLTSISIKEDSINNRMAPIERMANILSQRKILDLISPLKQEFPDISRLELERLLGYLICGYSDYKTNMINIMSTFYEGNSIRTSPFTEQSILMCPTYKFLKQTNRINVWKSFNFFDNNTEELAIKLCKNYNVSDRLLYGLPISYCEYLNLYNKYILSIHK